MRGPTRRFAEHPRRTIVRWSLSVLVAVLPAGVHGRAEPADGNNYCDQAGESPDLVLAGLQSDDQGYGQTGVIAAELLGLPHATIVIEVDYSGEQLRVKRELESGWYQWYTMQTPALLTIQSGISQIRYATLKGIMAAKKKEIREVQPALAAGDGEFQTVERVYLPLKQKQTQFLGDGDAKKGAAQLAEKLRNEARVI